MVGGFGHMVVNLLFLNVFKVYEKRDSLLLLVVLKARVG